MPIETINGTPLAYETAGEGPPVVLIHGSWSERHTWDLLIPALTGSFRLISYDLRGHGASTGDPEAGTVHDDVADVAALIEALKAAPAHIIGNSYGGNIALRLGAERPDLVSKVVCHEPGLLSVLEATVDGRLMVDEEWRKLGEVRRRLEEGDHAGGAEYFVDQGLGSGLWEQFPTAVRERMVRNAPTFLGELRDPDSHRVALDTLRELGKPTLLTYGDQSPRIFGEIVEQIARIAPDARRQMIRGAGHVPHWTHPEVYADVIRSFLLDDRA